MKTLYNKFLLLLLMLPATLLAQSKLSGIVTDKKLGEPLPGVNVLVKGTNNGVSTGFDGSFTLTNLKQGDIITFSFLGFSEQTITFTGQSNVSIGLQEESSKLDEVVVVGYGTVKKKDATGSVDLITSKDFNKGAPVSVDQLITGKVAGVRITNDGGSPDSTPNIRIRGGSSLNNAMNNPLIVIDGVPIGFDNPMGANNPLTLVNPNDVESFSVLKDASATAIYGSRASNGVVIITTKKGSSGKHQFTYSANVSISNVAKKINVMDANDFTRFINEYSPSNVGYLGYTDYNGNSVYANTNWQDAIFRTALSTDQNFSVKANLLKKVPFRASVGYNKSEGVVLNDDYKRYSTSLKLTPTVLDNHLKIDINAKGTFSEKNAIDAGGAIGGAVNMDPTKPIYDSTSPFGGYAQQINSTTNATIGAHNPVALLMQRKRPEQIYRLLGNVELDYKLHFFPELHAVVNLGLDASRSKTREYFSENSLATYQSGSQTFNPGLNYAENQTMTNKTLESYLLYTKDLKEGSFISKFDAQAGYSYQSFVNDGNKEIYQYNNTTGIRELNINALNPTNRYYNPQVLESFFGRTNFDLLNRYLFTLTMRADASSFFREEKRWGYFPAAGFAWKIKDESFLKNTEIVNDLKLRLSWGKTGQQNVSSSSGFFPSRALVAPGSGQSQYFPGYNTYSFLVYNPDITWETTTSYNAGLDFDFFKKGIISGSVDVYKRDTDNLLVKVPVPPGQYLSDNAISNIGSTSGKGIEVALTFKPIQSQNIKWSINTNVAYNRTEVTNLKDATQTPADGGSLPTGTNVNLLYHPVGYQPYSAWVFQQIYNQNGEVIPGAYVDLNGDGQITNADRYFKAVRPNWTYGFGTHFNYKNWDLTANFRGQVGGQVYDTRQLQNGYTGLEQPLVAGTLNNPLNFYDGTANANFANFNGNATFSDYMLQDASFLRCDNLSLSFSLPHFIEKASLKLTGTVTNAFLVTKYSGQDPENFNGIDTNFYPRPRTYVFGLLLDF